MTSASALPRVALAFALALAVASAAHAIDIGQIKVSKGDVAIERGGQNVPGAVGARLQTSDVIKTGADGSVGITMSDNSLLSAGPNSILSLDKLRVRHHDEPGAVRVVAAQGLAVGGLRPHRQAIAGRDDGAHAHGHPRRARHGVRRQCRSVASFAPRRSRR